ncbi:hypothetical protein [Hespellia stercorisuis]|uniref:Uncharacterized protein n=1 Tax=Hespellia stercorisuis DSM 15480 TaxID=1121950 RepID=A0A1M6S842_9FIRM|nr:hypothetical protein [Hespellia stercorisuis]SHK40831.1 hypothetical protein SAMN02745243_02875 [Hespellia stercorisuis DSM 15480]
MTESTEAITLGKLLGIIQLNTPIHLKCGADVEWDFVYKSTLMRFDERIRPYREHRVTNVYLFYRTLVIEVE